MKITNITTNSTKGKDLNTDLSGRDVFTGRNGAGKTTHLESVIIGILGYVPTKGKKLDDVFSMSSSDDMSVTITTDSEFKCTRSFKEKVTKRRSTGEKTYSLSSSTSIFPPRGEKTEADKKGRIASEIGDFPLMFDLDDFFNMSTDNKRSFIFSLTDPGQFGWDKDRVFASIAEDFGNEAVLSSLKAIWDDESIVQDNISHMIDWAKSELSESKAQLKGAVASKNNLIEQKQAMGASSRPRHDIIEELEASRKKLEKTTSTIASNSEKIRLLESLKRQKAGLDQRATEELPEPMNVSGLAEKLQKIRDDIAVEEEEIEKKRKQREKYSAALAGIAADKKHVDSQLESIKNHDGMCPVTGSACTSASDMKAAAESLRAEAHGLELRMIDGAKQIEDLDIIGLNMASGRSMMNDAAKAIESEISQELVMIEKRKAAEEAKSAIDAVNKQIAEMAVTDTSMLEVAVNGMRERVKSLEAESSSGQEVHDLEKAFDRANLDAIDLEEKIDVVEDLLIILGPGRIQGDILKDTVGPLVGKINALLKKTRDDYNLRLDLYDKNDRPTFDLFWDRGNNQIPFESLSGGERAIFSVAMLCALVIAKNPPTKVLCVEASEIDQNNLDMLLSAVNDFGDEIDNMLIATHITPADAPKWTTHALG